MKTTNKSTVDYVDHMGTDLTVCNAARVSFDKETNWEYTGSGTGEVPTRKLSQRDSKLVGYLAGHDHWSPFAHTSLQLRIHTSVFVARQLVKHCVTGDTEVTFCKPIAGKSNGRIKRTIEELYRMWSGKVKYQGGKKGKRNVSGGHIKVFNEDTQQFESSHITDVIYQGVKPLFLLTTKSGQSLRITGNHKVMTQRGWVAVEELIPNIDYMITEELNGTLINPGNKHRDCDVADVIARRNHVKLECIRCGATENLECDHIIPVNAGGTHTLDNLQTLCSKCHREKSAKEKSPYRPNAFQPRWTQVTSIEAIGSEDVYDITVDGWHNFLANGLVVHNCVGGVWNEVSRRYVNDEPEFYAPKWRWAVENKKQGSGEEVDEQTQKEVDEVFWSAVDESLKAYNFMLAKGISAEQARAVLNLNHMTSWYWTGSLMFFHRVYSQRTNDHAQKETKEVALQIGSICEKYFPESWKALVNQ